MSLDYCLSTRLRKNGTKILENWRMHVGYALAIAFATSCQRLHTMTDNEQVGRASSCLELWPWHTPILLLQRDDNFILPKGPATPLNFYGSVELDTHFHRCRHTDFLWLECERHIFLALAFTNIYGNLNLGAVLLPSRLSNCYLG